MKSWIISLLLFVISTYSAPLQVVDSSFSLRNFYNGSEVTSVAVISLKFDQTIYINSSDGKLVPITEATQLDSDGNIYLWTALAGYGSLKYKLTKGAFSTTSSPSSASNPSFIPIFFSEDPLGDLPHYDPYLRAHYFTPRTVDNAISFLFFYKRDSTDILRSFSALASGDEANIPTIALNGKLYSNTSDVISVSLIPNKSPVKQCSYSKFSSFYYDFTSFLTYAANVDGDRAFLAQLQGDISSLRSREIAYICSEYAFSLASTKNIPELYTPIPTCTHTIPTSGGDSGPSIHLPGGPGGGSVSYNTSSEDPCCNPVISNEICCQPTVANRNISIYVNMLSNSNCTANISDSLRDHIYYANYPPNDSIDLLAIYDSYYSNLDNCNTINSRACNSDGDCFPGGICRNNYCYLTGDIEGTQIADCYAKNLPLEVINQIQNDYCIDINDLTSFLKTKSTVSDCFGPTASTSGGSYYYLDISVDATSLQQTRANQTKCLEPQVCNTVSTDPVGSCLQPSNPGLCVRNTFTEYSVVPLDGDPQQLPGMCTDLNSDCTFFPCTQNTRCTTSCWQCRSIVYYSYFERGTCVYPNITNATLCTPSGSIINGICVTGESKANCRGIFATCPHSDLRGCSTSPYNNILDCRVVYDDCDNNTDCTTQGGYCTDYPILSFTTSAFGQRQFGACLLPKQTPTLLQPNPCPPPGFDSPPGNSFNKCVSKVISNSDDCIRAGGEWRLPATNEIDCMKQLSVCIDKPGGSLKNATECQKCGGTSTPAFTWTPPDVVPSPYTYTWTTGLQRVSQNAWLTTSSVTQLKYIVKKALVRLLASRITEQLIKPYALLFDPLNNVICGCTPKNGSCLPASGGTTTSAGKITSYNSYTSSGKVSPSGKGTCNSTGEITIFGVPHCAVMCEVSSPTQSTTAIGSGTTGSNSDFVAIVGIGTSISIPGSQTCNVSLIIRLDLLENLETDLYTTTFGLAELYSSTQEIVVLNVPVTLTTTSLSNVTTTVLRASVPCSGIYYPVALLNNQIPSSSTSGAVTTGTTSSTGISTATTASTSTGTATTSGSTVISTATTSSTSTGSTSTESTTSEVSTATTSTSTGAATTATSSTGISVLTSSTGDGTSTGTTPTPNPNTGVTSRQIMTASFVLIVLMYWL